VEKWALDFFYVPLYIGGLEVEKASRHLFFGAVSSANGSARRGKTSWERKGHRETGRALIGKKKKNYKKKKAIGREKSGWRDFFGSSAGGNREDQHQ